MPRTAGIGRVGAPEIGAVGAKEIGAKEIGATEIGRVGAKARSGMNAAAKVARKVTSGKAQTTMARTRGKLYCEPGTELITEHFVSL